jgi:bifunctional polynucleotide phosphatase/kinase
MNWITHETLLIGYYKEDEIDFKNEVICGFDLDHTLIQPKTGKKFPKNDDSDDWKFYYNNVINILTQYLKKGRIIIQTNQKKIKKDNHIEAWKQKILNIAKQLNIPFEIYASLSDDKYRKPLTNIWDKYIEYNDESFYCGDAIDPNKYHSACDLMLAKNLGITFKSPSEIFKNKIIHIPEIKYDSSFVTKTTPKEVIKILIKIHNVNKLNMIINVGFPGSGKSWFSKIFLKMLNYKIINQDTLKTVNNCKKMATKYLELNKNIVIDNTNMSKQTRNEWITLGKKYKTNIIILYFNASVNISKHNNIFRNITTNKKLIPNIAYNIMKSKFELPNTNEGVDNVFVIEPFFLDHDANHTCIYKQYLLA